MYCCAFAPALLFGCTLHGLLGWSRGCMHRATVPWAGGSFQYSCFSNDWPFTSSIILFSNGWLLRSDPWADGSALRRCVLRPFARRQRSSTQAGAAITASGASGGAAGAAGGGRAALRMHGLLSRFMWRHARSHVEEQIALPPCFERTVRIEFSAAERANYHQRQSELAVQVQYLLRPALCVVAVLPFQFIRSKGCFWCLLVAPARGAAASAAAAAGRAARDVWQRAGSLGHTAAHVRACLARRR